jgi:hypothetical protein
MVSSSKFSNFLDQGKLVIVMLGVLFMTMIALSVGFIIAIATCIFLPIITWLRLRKVNTEDKKESADFIEAEYVIMEEGKEEK